MKNGDVVSVVSVAGEFIGKLKEKTDKGVVLTDPRMLLVQKEGMGFARGIAISGEENPNQMEFFSGGILFVTPTNSDVEKAYRKMTSGIIL